MSIRTKLALIGLSTAIAFYAIIGGKLSAKGNILDKGDPYVQLKIFGDVLKHITRDYVDEPDMEKVRIGALRGLAEGLDPYSAYLTREQVARYNPEALKKNPLGVTFSKVGGFLYTVAVLKGSPAETAGLKNGDFVEYVGQVATRDVSLYDIQETIAALTNGQEIELTVLRRGKTEKLKIKSAPYGQPMIENRMEEGEIGYIKVTTLATGKAAEVKANLAALVKKGAKKIVLDLRGAANGELSEGVAVANLFVGNGPLARTIARKNETTKTFEAEADKVAYNGPLVVLTNPSTAGPAEVIAAAVIAAKRGEVVGEKTFGAGSEQELVKLSDGGAMLLTTVRYAPGSGKTFMEESVKPTVELKETAAAADGTTDDGEDDETATPAPENQTEKDKSKTDKKPAVQPAPEDKQLKKALELLKGGAPTAEKKAA
ncbi:MAG: PDZ domain-containing protein [Blastocatellia bacterium]|nr:PDZ domain-containing protein [Blastocatellia bacterium]